MTEPEDDEDEDGYEHGGVRFTVGILDAFDDEPGAGGEYTGLCVFVAPMIGGAGDIER
jgi:hypothetical protein